MTDDVARSRKLLQGSIYLSVAGSVVFWVSGLIGLGLIPLYQFSANFWLAGWLTFWGAVLVCTIAPFITLVAYRMVLSAPAKKGA